MVIINDQYKSSQVLTFLTSLAEDVDTENLDESRKNSVENFEKSKARGKAGR
jgi:hypothetical protein